MTMLTPLGRGGSAPRRRRNQAIRHAIVLLLALALLVAAGVTAWWYTFRTSTVVAALPACPTPTVTSNPPVVTIATKSIRVNVFNATSRQGLAARVAAELRTRGFVVTGVANDPLRKMVIAPAEIRYGPAGRAAAQTLALQVSGAVAAPDGRKNATVDLVLGMGFTALRSPAEVKSAAAPGKPAATTRAGASAKSSGAGTTVSPAVTTSPATSGAGATGRPGATSAGASCAPVPTVTVTAPGFLPSPPSPTAKARAGTSSPSP